MSKYGPVTCYLLVAVPRKRVSLRRYTPGQHDCSGPYKCHNALNLLGDFRDDNIPAPSNLDPRWPTKCDHCDYVFKPSDTWQVFTKSLFQRQDTAAITTIEDAPPGAMFDAVHYHPYPYLCGPDGHSWHVKVQSGNIWNIDGRANNCTKPNDSEHRCWVRHGEAPRLTVDKNGLTCQAGLGSIISGDYHGFLRDGVLTAG